MHDNGHSEAMSEIALALAMGFFSIMVLTMVTMGNGETGTAGKDPAKQSVAAMVAPDQGHPAKQALAKLGSDDLFVVYHKGRFLDRDLKPVDPAAIHTAGRVVLALDPDLPMAEAMRARSRVDVRNLIVSTLDERWRKTLARMEP